MRERDRCILPGVLGALTVCLLFSSSLWAQSKKDAYAKLPLSFEENQGQTDAQVRFLSRGANYSLFLTDSEAVLSLHANSRETKPDVLRMQLIGASRRVRVSGVGELPGKTNYFVGNDPGEWHRNV